MKIVNIETGDSFRVVISNKGFKVVYSHGLGIETYFSMRAVQVIEDDTYVVWTDYTVSYTVGFMFVSLETGEKFVVVRD